MSRWLPGEAEKGRLGYCLDWSTTGEEEPQRPMKSGEWLTLTTKDEAPVSLTPPYLHALHMLFLLPSASSHPHLFASPCTPRLVHHFPLSIPLSHRTRQ